MGEQNEMKEEKHEEGWEHGWHHRHWRGRSPWVPGLILILIGAFFLFRNFTGFPLENWWALFILIPAVGNFSGAYESFRESGSLNRYARSQLFWGLFFVLLSGSFLLALDFGLIWPAFLILGGLALLLGAL